jgi:glycosyltransferase involved in cell wall biosynthesis
MPASRQTLSVVIITHNEAHRLAACLDSVRFADEIVVVDSESTDNTVNIAKQYTARVFNQPWQGFGRQKQIALNHATGDWVLSLDADEILSPELQNNIQALLRAPLRGLCAGYKLRCITYFCGKPIYYGDWKGETKLRLFQRLKGRFTDDVVHEKLVLTEGKTEQLAGILYHASYPDLKTTLEKIQLYSSLGAEKKWAAGKQSSFTKALCHGFWAFIRGYIFKLGFLDGSAGFLVAFSRMEETFYRYLKLREQCLSLGLNSTLRKADMP